MSCCDETTACVPSTDLSRRSVLKGSMIIAGLISAVHPTRSEAQGKRVKLAYCSQLLCGVPYEVARSAGLFKNHGLDVELIYTRGGQSAMQALVGGAVDYAATALANIFRAARVSPSAIIGGGRSAVRSQPKSHGRFPWK